MRIVWRVTVCVALWLAFEAWISWAAFCNPTQGDYHQTAEGYDCVFNGPFFLILKGIPRLWNHLFHDADAYVALFTAVLALSTIALWRATQNLWAESRDTAKRQEANTKILQRAYLAVMGGGIDPFSNASVAHIIIRNVGNLPARNVKWFIDVELHADGRRSDFPIDDHKFYGNNVVPPGTEMFRSQNFFNIASADREKFRTGDLQIYVWGEIRYADGFNQQRYTRFCHRYGKRGLLRHLGSFAHGSAPHVTGEEVTAESMRYHQFGNDAD